MPSLGDDGRIFVSRVGINEPLYGIGNGVAAGQVPNELISTPGTMQEAVINTVERGARTRPCSCADNLDPSKAAPNTNTPAAALRQRHHLRRPRQRRPSTAAPATTRSPERRPLCCRTRTTTTSTATQLEHGAARERLQPSVQPGQRPRLQPDDDVPGAVRPERPVPRDHAERERLVEQDRNRRAQLAPELRSTAGPMRHDLVRRNDVRVPADRRQRRALRRPRQRLARRRHGTRHDVRRLGQRLPERRRRPARPTASRTSAPTRTRRTRTSPTAAPGSTS